MKESYRGYEIKVTRGKTMCGDARLFYSIFRESDQYEADSGYSYGGETEKEFMRHLKYWVDRNISDVDPWGEKGEDLL